MIQGGDPNSKNPDKSKHGMGGPGYTVKAEFNDKPHKRGTLSMARSAHPDSAGSQFLSVWPTLFSLISNTRLLERSSQVWMWQTRS